MFKAWITCILLVLAVVLSGCPASDDQPKSAFTITGNTGPVTVNNTTGSTSPIGTAPCGATASQKAGENQPAAPNCNFSTNNNPPPPSSEQTPS